MFVELVAIGDELLSGITVNTNAAFLGAHLTEAGWTVNRQTCLSDAKDSLADQLQAIIERAYLVIITGGLGPTDDDLTRHALEVLFDSPSVYNVEVALEIEKRFGPHLASLKNVATIPQKAHPLINPVGTAPGLIFHEKGRIVIALPGVPQEMRALFIEQVLPYLRKYIPPTNPCKRIHRHLSLLIEDAVNPFLRTWKEQYKEVSFGIYPHYGFLHISLSSTNTQALTAFAHLIDTQFTTYIFPKSLEQAVHTLCIERHITLALAESCTGGTIAASLTALPGSSAYFLGSLIVYSNALKEDLLHVPASLIAQHGSVSQETVEAMLVGLFSTTSADYGIAVSGIAGPTGGSLDKPIGTVWIAIGKRGGAIYSGKLLVKAPSREKVILYAKNSALAQLYRLLQYNIAPFSL